MKRGQYVKTTTIIRMVTDDLMLSEALALLIERAARMRDYGCVTFRYG